MSNSNQSEKLAKKLSTFDVYAVSTGAMFSSGFFLLPGLAAFQTGNSVYLAYLLAGILILPTMLSVAELSTAMPKAGGTYYFLDRSLGPLMGTIGGLGSWMALIFKSAFALIGMGAYLTLFVNLPILPLALVLTLAFGLLNIFGAKETAFLQRVLVVALVAIMALFIIQGVYYVFWGTTRLPERLAGNFFTAGINGFISTAGMVFVSYAGLTKVASIAEEVQNPDRAIPLGMFLSLLTATVVYVVGVYIMVSVLSAEDFFASLTPVAAAGEKTLGFLPGEAGVILIVIAALAAFASTGNAGIMSASRYPLAMARDGLISKSFARVGRFKTPTLAVVVTVVIMALVLFIEVKAIAKLASAFQLLLFFFVNLAVIVMRESEIEAYCPGFNSPLYPFTQLAGMIISVWLVAEMGVLAMAFTGTLIVFSLAWYFYYAYGKVNREGAIYHVHARLGKKRYEGLEYELMTIFHQKKREDLLSYETIIAQASLRQFTESPRDWKALVEEVAHLFAEENLESREELIADLSSGEENFAYLHHGMYVKYISLATCQKTKMVIAQLPSGLAMDTWDQPEKGWGFFFLVTPPNQPLTHMRIIGHLAELIDSETFLSRWKRARSEREVKKLLLSDERMCHLTVHSDGATRHWGGKTMGEIDLPGDCLFAVINRGEEFIFPHGDTRIEWGDEVTILGHPESLEQLLSPAEGEDEDSLEKE